MSILRRIRSHLAWKLFFSYLIVVIVGVVVLAAATELTIPRAFEHHLSAMGSMMSGMMGDSGMGMSLNSNLFAGFRRAVNEALLIAALAAAIVAVIVSVLISRRIVAPVQEMMGASQRIAEGRFSERVRVPGSTSPEQADELSRLAVSFNRMAYQLETTESMRRELMADVAHELRTPLSTIKGSMEGLIDGVLSADPETYQQVNREVDRMQRLVRDLQELSIAEAGAYEMQIRSVEVIQLMETMRRRLERQFEEKGVELEIATPAKSPQIDVDEDRIGQVLLNLVGNALQYTPPGGSVEVRSIVDHGNVVFSVRDTGVGITKEHLPHIFTRFYRVDKSRSRSGGGSGIGLTISKHIVEAHGGRIWAESEGANQGSTFYFSLPSSG